MALRTLSSLPMVRFEAMDFGAIWVGGGKTRSHKSRQKFSHKLTSYTINHVGKAASTVNSSMPGLPLPHTSNSVPHLSITKPSLVVRTESNVRKNRRKKPDPPCVVCEGSGREDCNRCHGKGRTNNVDSEMLPKGEWPKWCRTCGGSGLDCCSRCLGTGEYRYIMGFRFMKKDEIQSQENNP